MTVHRVIFYQRDSQMEKAEKQKTEAKEHLKSARNNLQKLQQTLEAQVLEKEAVVKEANNIDQQLQSLQISLEKLEQERQDCELSLNNHRRNYEQADEQLVLSISFSVHRKEKIKLKKDLTKE